MISNRSAPDAAIVPILVYRDVGEAIDFLCRVFGFTERLRATHQGEIMHAQLAFRDGAVMLGRQGGPFRPPSPEEVSQYVHVSVDDVDEHFARAAAAGVTIIKPPANMPFGERQYTVLDPGGHRWTFSQHVEDLAPEDWGAISAPSANASVQADS